MGELIFRIGTKSPLNYGQLVFDNVVSHMTSTAVKKSVCYPSMIFGIMMEQQSDILTPEDVILVQLMKYWLPLSYKMKLFMLLT